MLKSKLLRHLSLVLAIIICFSCLPLTATAASGADDIMAVAVSQLGYKESYNSKGVEITKYGDYFGYQGAWCGAFISWCARTAGISQNVIPTNFSSTAIMEHYKALGRFHLSPSYGGESYLPKKGDIVIFTSFNPDNRSKDNIEHVGLVLEATSTTVTCVEGNCPDEVASYTRKYIDNNCFIVGFASPDYEGSSSDSGNKDTTYKTGKYKTNDAMNFRVAPGEEIITLIKAGTILEITAIEGIWGKTTFEGKEGWLSLEYSTYIPDVVTDDGNDATTQYRVCDTTNIRASYTESSTIIGQAKAGTLIQVSEVSADNWGKVNVNGQEGWMCLDWSIKFEPEIDWLVVDISQWNSPDELDWNKLKAQDVKGVIIRIGGRYASGEKAIYADDEFLRHYKDAKAVGMKVGVYFFSYALSEQEAVAEAKYCIDTLKNNNCSLDLPIYIDMEDLDNDRQHVTAGKEVCSLVLDTFCKTVEEAGYFSGIYVSEDFANNFVNPEVFANRSTWIAEWYKDTCSYNGEIAMWQYSKTGKLDGAKKDIDLNRLYVNYPAMIKENKFKNGLICEGDIDGNGVVSAADSRLALRYSVALETFTDIEFQLADVTKDGKVTSKDARAILLTSVQL